MTRARRPSFAPAGAGDAARGLRVGAVVVGALSLWGCNLFSDVLRCDVDQACPDDQACVAGACVPGARDAGAGDAGVLEDAGPDDDAGLRDAGVVDDAGAVEDAGAGAGDAGFDAGLLGDGGPADAGTADDVYVAAHVAALQLCFGPDAFLSRLDPVRFSPPSQGVTEARARDPLARLRSDPLVVVDEQRLQTCIAAFAAASGCSEVLALEQGLPPCDFAEGTLAEDAVCAAHVQCDGPAACDAPTRDGCGRCEARGRAGDPCTPEGRCAQGLECALVDGGQVCAAPVAYAEGDPCDEAIGCGFLDGLACVGEPDGSPACRPVEIVPLDGGCDELGPLGVARACAGALSTTSCVLGVCTSRPGVGEPCPRGVCDERTATCRGGSCVPAPVEGEACPDFACALPASCIDGVCRGPAYVPPPPVCGSCVVLDDDVCIAERDLCDLDAAPPACVSAQSLVGACTAAPLPEGAGSVVPYEARTGVAGASTTSACFDQIVRVELFAAAPQGVATGASPVALHRANDATPRPPAEDPAFPNDVVALADGRVFLVFNVCAEDLAAGLAARVRDAADLYGPAICLPTP